MFSKILIAVFILGAIDAAPHHDHGHHDNVETVAPPPPVDSAPHHHHGHRDNVETVTLPDGTVKHLHHRKRNDASFDPTVNAGNSYMADTGVKRRTQCNRGLIDKTATGIQNTIDEGANKLTNAVSAAVNSAGMIGNGAKELVKGGAAFVTGINDAIGTGLNDAACGIGNMANDIASGIQHGHIIQGAARAGKEFIGGIANIGEDIADNAARGVGKIANAAISLLG